MEELRGPGRLNYMQLEAGNWWRQQTSWAWGLFPAELSRWGPGVWQVGGGAQGWGPCGQGKSRTTRVRA